MSSHEEQLSYQQKLQNARSTRGHRRTQSNSQYDFTQLKVAPKMSEEEKKNKEDFEKMIQLNRIMDASSTVEALDAQKHNQEDKKTIVDCIDEDLSAQGSASSSGSSAGSSMFNFGKNLHKKKRHNSDVGPLSRNDSSLFSDLNKNDDQSQFRTKRVNDYEEDDEEAEDDFDSMFFQKYKKFGYSNQQNGFPYPSYNDGLYSIPELANSSEFGTSINKDTQSIHSHKKSLANTTKILNTHPSNSSSTDFTAEQSIQQKGQQAVNPFSFLSGQNYNQGSQQQQQSAAPSQQQSSASVAAQQNIINKQVLKLQQQEYEQAKQNYQINQILRQQQALTQSNSQLASSNANVQREIASVPTTTITSINETKSAQPLHSAALERKKTTSIHSSKNISPITQNTSNKSAEQAKDALISQANKNQKSQSHSPISNNFLTKSSNLNTHQQNISPLPQSTSPLSGVRNPTNPSPKSLQQISGQIVKSGILQPNNQQVNPSLTSSSNISQYHHSRVESSSSQFCVQSYVNDLKDSNISKVSKRNSIHEILNTGSSSSYVIPSVMSQNGHQTLQHQRQNGLDSFKLHQQQSSQQQQTGVSMNTDIGRMSNLSEQSRPSGLSVQQFTCQINESSNKENSPHVSGLINSSQQMNPLFPPKINLLLNKTSIDRKDIGKQRYSTSQNDSEEQHSMIETITSPKEGRVSLTPSIAPTNTLTNQSISQVQSSSYRANSHTGEYESLQNQKSKGMLHLPQQTQNQTYIPSQSSSTSQNSGSIMNFSNQLNIQQINNQNNSNNNNYVQTSSRNTMNDQPYSHQESSLNQQTVPMHQSSQSFSLNKNNIGHGMSIPTHKITQSNQFQGVQNSQQQQHHLPIQTNNYVQNQKNTYSSSNISNSNSARNQAPPQIDQHQRKTSVNINISNLLTSNHQQGNSVTSSNSKNSNNNISIISNNTNNNKNENNSSSFIHQINPNQQQHGSQQQTMTSQQASQIQQQLHQFQQQQFSQQISQQQIQQSYSNTIDSEIQSKTYAQIIKEYLKNNGNSSRLNSNNTLGNVSGSVSKNNSSQNTLKKSTTNIQKEQKPKNSSISTNPLASKSNQGHSLEGRVFLLESKVLTLKQKTENLEKQNLNLTQELIRINEEKQHYIKENLESKLRITELETVTKKNEENIQIILQMIQKSQSDYELMKYQKQEVSTNIFTDISCLDSPPNDIQNLKVQKQVLLQNKNMNQILESGDPRYNGNGNHSYLLREQEQKFQSNCNVTNSNSYANNQKGSFILQQQQAQNASKQNKYYNENTSFNSLLQQKKSQNTQNYLNNPSNLNNILKPSNLNQQNLGRFSAYH